MQEQTKTLGIIIGRFQPLHDGHKEIIRKAKKLCDKLLIVVGSSNVARTIKNPWTYTERRDVIQAFLNREGLDFEDAQIIPINDYKYSDTQWMLDVQEIANLHATYGKKILFGFDKQGNDYLKWFPQYGFHNIESTIDINATDIRSAMMKFPTGMTAAFLKLTIPEDVQADYEYFKKEKAQFANYPYPETLNFNCADALIECNGHVLLIKRKFAPGRNCWALPGGFKNNTETFTQTAIREAFEETNLRIPEKVLVGSIIGSRLFDSPTRGSGIPRTTFVVHFKIAPDADGKLPRANGADDAAECKWVPIADAVNTYRLHDDHCDIIQVMTGTKPLPAFYNPSIINPK